MKISFSTLGCPEWSFKDIIASAKDFGYDGIELRGIEGEIYLPHVKEFTAEKIEETKAYLAKTGMEISCLTSGALLYKDCEKEVKDYINLASTLGVKYIRVLGDEKPQASVEAKDEAVIASLEKFVPMAEQLGVTLCLETNGIYANSARLAKIAAHFEGKVGVIWDIHHPYRFFGEDPSFTYENLKDYICHLHIKDSVLNQGTIQYKMLGEGDIPVKEVIHLLKENEFSGFVSLEWVKRWNMELEEPNIVFARFIDYIKTMNK